MSKKLLEIYVSKFTVPNISSLYVYLLYQNMEANRKLLFLLSLYVTISFRYRNATMILNYGKYIS